MKPRALWGVALLGFACGGPGQLRPSQPAAGAADAAPPIGLPGADAAGADPRPPACRIDASERGQAGCRFFVVPAIANGCFVAYVVNPGRDPVRVSLAYHQASISVAQFGRRISRESGMTVLEPYDEAAGLPGHQALVLFLNESRHRSPRGPGLGTDCPIPAVHEHRGLDFWPARESTGVGDAYRISTDGPVIAYQFYGYARASWSLTTATLLLPAEAWGKTTLVATPKDALVMSGPDVTVIAAEDDTEVKFRPSADICQVENPEATVRSGVTTRVVLKAGEFVQFAANETRPNTPLDSAWPPLSGSVVQASKPVGVLGHTRGFRMPLGSVGGAANQQMPPFDGLGHEYVAVRYPDRLPNLVEDTPWQIVGGADGTTLTYEPAPPADAPLTLAVGQVAHFWSKTPFIVRSQDDRHPFYLGGYMTDGAFVAPDVAAPGRPLFVNVVPTAQYDRAYAFFIDPELPETRLVIVRRTGDDGRFADVKLACAATPVAGFRALGAFEYAQVTLTAAGKPAVPGCDGVVHVIESTAPFSVTVWGWGASRSNPDFSETNPNAYAYPAGARARPANQAPPIVVD